MHYKKELHATKELQNVCSAIRWGTDYFLKCSVKRNQLYVQVGDPVVGHTCWMRPENMKTPRTFYKISKNMPGTEIAVLSLTNLEHDPIERIMKLILAHDIATTAELKIYRYVH